MTTERAVADEAPRGLVEGAAVVVHVPPGPVAEAATAVRSETAHRPLVALGGGRVIDAAKAIAAADGLRVAAIPTTLAGSAFTPFHRLPTGVEGVGMVRPALAVCDPNLMASAAMPGLAATAMNALAHAVEALYAPGANPVAEGAALRAAGLFASGFRAATAPAAAEPVRTDLALGALLAGWAVGTTGLAVHHALCQTIVRVVGTPHAATNAVMLPHSVAFMTERAPREIALLRRALDGAGAGSAAGAPPADAPAAIARLAALSMVTSLAQLGFDPARAAEVASVALHHPGIAATPCPRITHEDLHGLLAAAL